MLLLFLILSILNTVYIHRWLLKKFPQQNSLSSPHFDRFVALGYIVVILLTFVALLIGKFLITSSISTSTAAR